MKGARESLHEALTDPRPKLRRRFKIDIPQLNKVL